MPLIDALKAVASQLIVLHHLAFYGPMSDWMQPLAPGLVNWLSRDARMAVQVFLVISGFLAIRALAPQGVLLAANPLAVVRKRYISIALPCVAALGVAMACTELARLWMTHHSVPAPPGLAQFAAHALLLHSLLGMDSLSAGVWYVAIDFQLFVLLVGLLWVARRWGGGHSPWPAVALVLGMGAASLLHFNRHAHWDNWALYFFGAFAAGALAGWAGTLKRGGCLRPWLWAGLAVALLALALDYRTRIALALAVAVLLAVAQARGWLTRWPRSVVLGYLGRISYGVFLMNFPVALVVNAVFTRFAPAEPWVQTLGVGVAWVACLGAGALFFHGVEAPIRRWHARSEQGAGRYVSQ
jgi:peptidoglycan/LPS O-acetylase OafA/YrhL